MGNTKAPNESAVSPGISPTISPAKSELIVLCDFDGTISQLDVGNEIHRSLLPDQFTDLQKRYRAQGMTLRELQNKMWQDFPLSKNEFRKQALPFAKLRPGFSYFLRQCFELKIPFYIASCGIRDYIEAVLEVTLDSDERQMISGLYCNDVEFADAKIKRLITPESAESDLTLDKGRLADELRLLHGNSKVLGIGNGGSDRSMAGHVDVLAATDALARWAESKKLPFVEFNDFSSLSIPKLFAK